MIKILIQENLRAKKNRPLSFIINLVGMALALTAVFVIYLHITAEINHDKELFKGNKELMDRTVRVEYKDGYFGSIVPGALKSFIDKLPQIEASTLVLHSPNTVLALENGNSTGNVLTMQTLLATQEITKIFPFKVLSGEIHKAINTKNGAIITRSAAIKLFEKEDVVGEMLKIEGKTNVTIGAVIEDVPQKTAYKGEIILNISIWEDFYNISMDEILVWTNWNYDLLALLEPQVDKEKLEKSIEDALYELRKEQFAEEAEKSDIILRSYIDCYLPKDKLEYSHAYSSNKRDLSILGLISILIFVIAIINYINIYVARSLDIIRTMGIRAIFGANRIFLSLYIITDAILTVFLSSIIAYFMTWTLMPMLNKYIGFELIMNPDVITIITLFIIIPIISGVLAGIYPAIILTKQNPIDAINKKALSASHSFVRGILIVLQFTISIVLISSTILINKQINYVLNMDTGYSRENIYSVKGGMYMSGKTETFRDRLLNNPNISNLTFIKQAPINIHEFMTITSFSEQITVNRMAGDENTLDVLGIELIEGSPLNKEAIYSDTTRTTPYRLMNETLAKKIKSITGDSTMNLPFNGFAGVIKDFQYRSVSDGIGPLIFELGYGYEVMGGAFIKISGTNVNQTIKYIEDTFKEIFPDQVYEGAFLNKQYNIIYKAEQILRFRLLFFSILAIVIASLGVFALINYSVEKRRKEIAIRKVYGSTIGEVVAMLIKGVAKWIIISFVIAVPLTIYLMNLWLDQYVYKTELSVWVFIVACLGTALVAISTTLIQTYLAAVSNPANAVKNE